MSGLLKGGNVVGIRAMIDGEEKLIQNDDGSALTFLVENQDGEILELQLTIGRMGTYTMLAAPPIRFATERYDEPAPAGLDQLPVAPPTRAEREGITRSRVRVGAGRGRAVSP